MKAVLQSVARPTDGNASAGEAIPFAAMSDATGKSAACPACLSLHSVRNERAGTGDYVVSQCQNCYLSFSEPMVAADSTWYASSWLYRLRDERASAARFDASVPWNFACAIAALGPAGGRNLLDVGCAEGHFLELAQKAGFGVTGFDFNPASVAMAQKLLGISAVHQCSVEELPNRFPDSLHDVVTIFEVLEHTADPFQTVCSLKRVLKPGGQLLLSVPGIRRLPALFDPEVDAPPHHLTLWTPEAITNLLVRAGFRVLSITAKPLAAEDIGLHLMWRLQKTLRRTQANSNSESGKRSVAMRLAHQFTRLALLPLCAALRLHERAGGFTLFAQCEKPR